MSDPQENALMPPYDAAVVDTTVSQEARAYDYLLGGVDHFEVDRAAVLEMYGSPEGVELARKRVRANRNFLGRAIRFLAGEVGIRQFLDLGTGIPNADNVHGVAQATAPDCKVVYVDHDPVVLAHAHKLNAATAAGQTLFVFSDIRDHESVLRQAARILDFDQPIGLVIVGVLHHFRDEEDPKGLVRRYLDAVPSGSYLVMEQVGRENDAMQKLGRTDFTMVPRTRAEFAPFFEGVELVEPGLVFVDQWRPDGPPPDIETRHPCGVGRKP
ncbi:MAG TPA: SAM-dependent methyltransferase [Acidimicrobiales bacterium]